MRESESERRKAGRSSACTADGENAGDDNDVRGRVRDERTAVEGGVYLSNAQGSIICTE